MRLVGELLLLTCDGKGACSLYADASAAVAHNYLADVPSLRHLAQGRVHRRHAMHYMWQRLQ